jgi:L-threonine kinase
MEATAYYPGSVGELIQGSFHGRDILLSCPVNLYSRVKVFESKLPEIRYKNNKTDRFLKNVLKLWGYDKYENILDIEICSQIPRGKGFASSTADLCALYYALLGLFNREFNQRELIEECILIEPTDSIIFKEMTLFEYKTGNFYESIGDYLEFYVLVFEGSNIVDTIEFNKKPLPPLANINDLIPTLKSGISGKDIRKIADVSTESILRNQHRLRYDSLMKVLKISSENGGLGVIGAHSGDCLGIIFNDEEQLMYVKNHSVFNDEYRIYMLKSIVHPKKMTL